MAWVRDISEIIGNMKPSVSPVSKKYMIVNWISVFQDEPGVTMKNFEISKLYLAQGKDDQVYLSDFPSDLCLTPKDSRVFGILIKSRYRIWFMCVSDPRMIAVEKNRHGVTDFEEGEIEEIMGQTGYLCIRLLHSEDERVFRSFYEHWGYHVRVVDGFPWRLDYNPDVC